MDLAGKVEQAIRRRGLLAPGKRVAVACSGGADSVALLLLLEALKERLGLRLSVVHLNHSLRGDESDTDEAFVRQLAERSVLDFVGRKVDVAELAKKRKLNLEEAGRHARLEFFASLMADHQADAIALAHTMDDQAETVLARLLRGAGTRGLAGIHPVVELGGGRLVRPLLGCRRAELREYLAEREQAWREDSTNLDRRRLRNRIRLDLLPQLDSSAVAHLARLAEHAREEESFWSAAVEERFCRHVVQQGAAFELSVAALLTPGAELTQLPERAACEAQRALARRLVRRVLRAVRGDLRRITQSHVESVLRLAEEGQSGLRVQLPGAVVERAFDRLILLTGRVAQETSPDFRVRVEGPGSVSLLGGETLSFKLVAVGELESGYNNSKVAADAARVPFPLLVRPWQPGDSFRPAGATRRKKLKTLFRQARVPVGERRRTPVVLCGDEIAWVPPFGVAAGFELTAGSRTALLIRERVEQ